MLYTTQSLHQQSKTRLYVADLGSATPRFSHCFLQALYNHFQDSKGRTTILLSIRSSPIPQRHPQALL